MKITIITVARNSVKTIKHTIESVLSQTYKAIEYIIIDGYSTDGTLEIINKYKKRISKIISEKDKGIYDAINKGIKKAKGEIIGILNSDDVYENKNIIKEVAEIFKKKKTDSLYADLVYVDHDNINKTTRLWKSFNFTGGSFKKGFHPPHPTFFVKRKLFEKYGYYDINFKISADFELMLRFLEKYKISTYYLPKTIIRMRTGGTSNKNIINHLIGNINCYRAFKKNKIKVPVFYLFFRIIPKLFQFINVRNSRDHSLQERIK